MTIQKVWLGSTGPLLYDDSQLIEDIDGDLSGEFDSSISTTGQLLVAAAPTGDFQVVRLIDLEDALSEIEVKSGASTDKWTIDPTSKAGRVTLYDSLGIEIKQHDRLITYSCIAPAFTPGATPQDVLTITGSASKTIKVLAAGISTTQTTAGTNLWQLLKRSTANSGGTSSNLSEVPHDSADASATATVLSYTANPTAGTLIGGFWIGRTESQSPRIEVDFIKYFGKPLILRGTGEVLSWNFNGTALPTGLSVVGFFTWIEE